MTKYAPAKEPSLPIELLPLCTTPSPSPFLNFHKDGQLIGTFDYVDGEWTFDGNADESAEIFLNAIVNRLDQYLSSNGWIKPDECS